MSREIPLTQGYVALVNDEDYEDLARHRWHANVCPRTVYARRNVPKGSGQTTEYMHERITGYGVTDHENGDGLDNRRENLRPATRVQNNRNSRSHRGSSSEYVGVAWHKVTSKWQAVLRLDGKQKYLGLFPNEEDAARAYDKAAFERDPEFCRLNFPEEYGK